MTSHARGRSHSAEAALAFVISTIRPLIDARSVAGRGNGRVAATAGVTRAAGKNLARLLNLAKI